MKQLSLFVKKLRLGKVLMVLIAGFVLLLNTACSSGDVRGARPDNLPVQMGGNNNPHTRGGDGYTNYKMSTDPKVNRAQSKKQAALPGSNVIADTGIRANASDLLYPGSNLSDTDRPDIGPVKQKSLPDLPNPKQPVLDRNDPNARILERVGETFKDASSFLKDTADSAAEHPEMQVNPAVGQ